MAAFVREAVKEKSKCLEANASGVASSSLGAMGYADEDGELADTQALDDPAT